MEELIGGVERDVCQSHGEKSPNFCRWKCDVTQINQVVNYALVEWDDNIAISDGPPSAYWPEYGKRFGDEALAQMRMWHALPENWWNMFYGEFLAARRPLIAEVIRAGYQKLT